MQFSTVTGRGEGGEKGASDRDKKRLEGARNQAKEKGKVEKRGAWVESLDQWSHEEGTKGKMY